MKKQTVSIKTQLTLTFIVISSLVVFAVTYFNFNSNVTQQKDSFLQNSVIQANLLADFSVSALVFMDIDGMNENLDKLKNNKDIRQVVIYDVNKEVVAQYNPLNYKNPESIVPTQVIFDKKRNLFLDFGILKISVPIQHKEKVYGILYLEKSTEIISSLLKKVFREVLGFTLILLAIIYLLSIILSNYLLKPILSLAEVAQEIALTGDYSTRVKYNSKNEIGKLYRAFNILLKDTQTLTNDLERQVNKRTKQLQKSINDLQETQQHLIESEKMSALGNLVSGIAHEVNTPLGNAITSSSIITRESVELKKAFEEGSLKKSTLQTKLNILDESSALLVKTLNYASNLIKSFKQISVDQVTNDVRDFELNTYLEEIFLTNHNKLKLVPVQTDIIAHGDTTLNTSPGVIAQIFNNLIQNSTMHAFDKYSRNAKITVTLKKRKNDLLVVYEDNGKGINEDIKEKVFEPFVTTKRNEGGTGLGLNIVYNLVHQKLKGSLELISIETLGTKFIITIPLKFREDEEKK
jgi:signal transduction histidine kinase